MGFSVKWVNMLFQCVSSISFQELINGKGSKHFKPSRGLRQGDPLSPLLFVLCTEGFSGLINKQVADSRWQGINMGIQAPTISHLFFANDSLLFMRIEEQSLRPPRG